MRWLNASNGYILKRNVWVAFKRPLGCACIFSLNNGTFGGNNFGGVRNGPAFLLDADILCLNLFELF
jgi:hypothetical protein